VSEVRILNTDAGRMVELPKGTRIKASLHSPISSRNSRVGQEFSVSSIQPIYLGSTILIPAGTRIYHSVEDVAPPEIRHAEGKGCPEV
jgi:hypothetical protein